MRRRLMPFLLLGAATAALAAGGCAKQDYSDTGDATTAAKPAASASGGPKAKIQQGQGKLLPVPQLSPAAP